MASLCDSVTTYHTDISGPYPGGGGVFVFWHWDLKCIDFVKTKS